MFVNAIETAGKFTRPLHTISRNFGSSHAVPGAATLFFVNAEGWALTCKHVAQMVLAGEGIKAQYDAYRSERVAVMARNGPTDELNALVHKYGYHAGVTAEIFSSFVNCVEGGLEIEIHLHPSVDAALIKFNNFTKLLCDSFPVFAADGSQLKPGRSICRLGFPFPEFRNYEYDAGKDEIRWNADRRDSTPRFPIDGMVTRMVNNESGATIGFELSTPGLRGQSGGPAFDVGGRIWGMQSATGHLDLDFDVDIEVLRNGVQRRVQDSAFLHVGHCVHVDILKDFMRANGVSFNEA